MIEYKEPMIRFVLIVWMVVASTPTKAQQNLRPVTQLIVQGNTGWQAVRQMIQTAKNKVEVLPCDSTKAKTALYATQVTSRSPMGGIVLNTGGLLVAKGWIRILGSGSAKLNRSLPDWNMGKSMAQLGEKPTFLLVADDVLGGFFAINGGAFGQDTGKVYYMSPSSLDWEEIADNYTDFLSFCFNENLAAFYEDLGWKTLQRDAMKISGDKVFNFVPPLWSKQGKDIGKNQRTVVPVEEQYQFNQQIRKQLNLDHKAQ